MSVWALFMISACEWTTVSPLIESFEANPGAVAPGESVTLSWSVVGAASLRLMPGEVDVSGVSSMVVQPLATTTYELVAENAAGSASREVQVQVVAGPVVTSFEANPGAVAPGESVTLSWSVVGAESLRLMPGDIDVSELSSTVLAPLATTAYELIAENGTGSVSREIEVLVGDPPVIMGFSSDRGLVNPGLDVTLTWDVADAETLVLQGPGLGSGVAVDGTSERVVTASAEGATFTLVAGNVFGQVDATLQVARDVSAVSVLVVGQSNAMGFNISASAAATFITAEPGVMMLGNDYVWKPAAEPLDAASNQEDSVSADTNLGVSAGVSLGNQIVAVTGGEAFLIPAAKGGSRVSEWLPGVDRYDRGTLFGSAANRGRLAGLERWAPLGHRFDGHDFGAIYWYQGESNASATHVGDFVPQTQVVLDAFQEELDAPIILAQLARNGSGSVPANLYFQQVREAQRAFETGARTAAGQTTATVRERTYLVVTHDLPMRDNDSLHLSAAGQVELGRRIALAIREHLFGEIIDGSGPRLVRVEKTSATTVRVFADRPVTPPLTIDAAAYSGYFTVIADGATVPIASIQRVEAEPNVIRIMLASAVAAGISVEVRYMPPPVRITAVEEDVIRSLTCAEPMPTTDVCLPMPAFGAAADDAELGVMSTYTYEIYE